MAQSIPLPYINAYGNISKALEKIKNAAVPDRFSQDFLADTLGMKGGSARPVLPYLKRTGFLAPDGTPTALYQSFRNPTEEGAAAAKALRAGYGPLFQMVEKAHTLDDSKLKGLIVQATGLPQNSKTVSAILHSFKALNAFADPSAAVPSEDSPPPMDEHNGNDGGADDGGGGNRPDGFNLSYTINLNLPATSGHCCFQRDLQEPP